MLSEISQAEKDRYHMFSLICGSWETQQKTRGEGKGEQKKLQRGKEANHKRLLNTENKLRVDGWRRGGVGRGESG